MKFFSLIPSLNRSNVTSGVDSSIFVCFLTIGLAALSCLSTVGFEPGSYDYFAICGTSLLLTSFSTSLTILYNFREKRGFDALTITVLLLIIMAISLLPLVMVRLLVFPIALAGFLSFGFLIYCSFRGQSLLPASFGLLVLVLLSWVLAAWITGSLYAAGYHHPLWLERLSLGIVHKDQLFHVALTQMINTYGVASTGLQEPLYTHYHFGSHIILGRFAEFFGFHPLKAYNVVYPILFTTLYVRVMLCAIRDIGMAVYGTVQSLRPSNLFWIIFTVFVIGVLPNKWAATNLSLTDSWLYSESYLVSLMFLFMSISLVLMAVDKDVPVLRRIGICLAFLVVFAAMAFSKISVSLVMMALIPYLVLRARKWKDPVLVVTALLALVIGYIAIKASQPVQSTPQEFAALHHIRTWVDGGWRSLYVPATYLFLLLYLVARMTPVRQGDALPAVSIRAGRFMDIEFLLLLALVSFMPGAVMAIGGGSADYFSNLGVRVPFVFLMAWILHQSTHGSGTGDSYEITGIARRHGFILAVGICMALYNVTSRIEDMLNVDLNVRFSWIAQASPASKYYADPGFKNIHVYTSGDPLELPDKLAEIAYMPAIVAEKSPVYTFYRWVIETSISMEHKEDYYIWVQKNQNFWEGAHYDRDAIPLIIPAVTGISQVNGLPTNYKTIPGYGYDAYYNIVRDSGDCHSIGSKKTLVISPYVQQLNECPTDASGSLQFYDRPLYKNGHLLDAPPDDPAVAMYMTTKVTSNLSPKWQR